MPNYKGLIFSTCYLDPSYGKRWEYWFDYYREVIPEYELITFHDGPIPEGVIDRDKYPIVELTPHLSRVGLHHVPGWQRSFLHGLLYAKEKQYNVVCHIESDLYFKRKFIPKLKKYLELPGWFSGWCRHNFMEESIQILNSTSIREGMIEILSDNAQIFAKGCIPGVTFQQKLGNPEIVFNGERLEVDIEQLLNDPKYEYFAQFHYNQWSSYL